MPETSITKTGRKNNNIDNNTVNINSSEYTQNGVDGGGWVDV